MSELNYYSRFEKVWESIGCKSANEFALRLGFDRSEKIARLNPDRSGNKKQTGKPNLPGIEIIEAILRKYPHINARWLMIGEGEPFIHNQGEKNKYLVDEQPQALNEPEPCKDCNALREKVKMRRR